MGRPGSGKTRKSLIHWYVAAGRSVLRLRDAFIMLGFAAHGMGQIAMVLVAAACARLVATGAIEVDVLRLCGLGVSALVFRSVGGVIAAHGQARISADVGAYLRLRVLEGWFARKSFHAVGRPRQSDHGVFSLTEGIRALEAGLSSGWMGILRAIFQLVPLAIVLAWLEPRLAAISTVVLLSFALVLRSVRTRVASLHKGSVRATEELTAAADDAVRHADVWRVFGAEEKAKARVRSIGAAIGRRSARLAATTAAVSGANEVLAGIVLLALVGLAHAGWLGGVRIERLLPFVVTFFLAYRPLRDWAEAQLALGRARAAWDSIGDLLDDATPTPRESRTFQLATLDVEGLELPQGIGRPLAFSIAPGEIVALRGPTGIGKTTLLRVLLGLDAERSGAIRWDGKPLVGDARPFAWVPQDAPMLDGSLEANVTLADDRADVRAVLESIGAEHLASRPEARTLSGGERQLVALARALATDRPVLLLDEPTSGLDPDAQTTVLEAIERLRGKRSVLIVTHRAEPLAIADHVIELSPERVSGSMRVAG